MDSPPTVSEATEYIKLSLTISSSLSGPELRRISILPSFSWSSLIYYGSILSSSSKSSLASPSDSLSNSLSLVSFYS